MRRVLAGAVVVLLTLGAQHPAEHFPVAVRSPAVKKATELLRRGKTAEARQELQRLVAKDPSNPEIRYQIARTHLADFFDSRDPARGRISLALAMEELDNTLRQDPNHVYALKSKAVIHARAELLYYDPNLAYELAARIAKLQPSAHEYLLGLTDWMSGEIRFAHETGHRVPHDPLLGLDRSIEILEYVLDMTVPRSKEEAAALFAMANTLAKRGNFPAAIEYYELVLRQTITPEQRLESLREMGAAWYRMGKFGEAARTFFQAWQFRPNSLDQWLLKVALDHWTDAPPLMPRDAHFPAAETWNRVPPGSSFGPAPLIEFTDMAKELGVNRRDGNGTCAWGDYDLDGDLDLALAGSGTFMALYRNDGARFTEVTAEAGLASVPSGYSLNFVDYDNDGRLDLYVSLNGWSGPQRNRLFRNLGNGRFEDVSKQSGLDDPGSGFVSLWGDLDQDGDLDVAIANGVLKDGSVPQLYRNNGNGTFTNMTRAAGLNEPASWGAIGIALGDYNRDGRLDLFINGLENSPNRLYRNDGSWRFTEVARQAGVTQPNHNGFVAFFFDYNNDGWPDLLTTSLAPWETTVESYKRTFAVRSPRQMHPDCPRLFRNNKDGTFIDVTFESKLYYPMGIMGAGVADLDNDGHVDVYFGVGDPQLSRLEPNRFFRNNGDGTFADLSGLTGFARPGSKGHGVSFVDIDGDGDLDVYQQLGGHYPGDHAENGFYRNLKGNQNNWLQVDLTGTRSNRYAVGAALVLRAAGLVLYREVKGSEGFGSTDPYRVHFGLGKRTKVDSLEIRWPAGATQVLTALDANQVLRITEGEP